MTLTLQEATGKNVILLPMGASDDGAHSQEHTIIINIIMQLILTTKLIRKKNHETCTLFQLLLGGKTL